MDLRRIERLVRSSILATPFRATNMASHYEIEGREHLEAALERRARTGGGLITISNHQSLFDDPIVLFQLVSPTHYSVETKAWWSTPCEHNFSPAGSTPKDRFVRYFSGVSNMVFFERPGKNGNGVRRVDDYAALLARRGGAGLARRVEAAAAAAGTDAETWLRRFVTTGDVDKLKALNQAGMIEACARVATGDWLHLFPEGGRSRTLSLRKPKRGVGKVIYHCPDAQVLPICFYGMHDVLPVKAALPRPFKKVVVTVGEPVPASRLDLLRRLPPSAETFQAVVEAAWESVVALRPNTLVKYLGPAKAEELLLAEAPAAYQPAGEVVGHPTASSAPSLKSRRSTTARMR